MTSIDTWPDWCDAGKRVEIIVDNTTTCGTLAINDFGHDGTDEYPIFTVIDDNKVEHCFAMNDTWRFL